MNRHAVVVIACVATALLRVSAEQVRDATTQPAIGTATIIGRVTAADEPAVPLRRAIVTIRGSNLPVNRSAITDDDGRFAIRNLPSGRVTIVAAKAGYVTGGYGATRPGRAGTPVELAVGQTVDATIRLF